MKDIKDINKATVKNKTVPTTTGGGVKKVIYTLSTIQRIGLRNSAKALTSHNACKACGLGMGGQRGGMTNELDEFPSVCNKSIQAQSTDIQPAIPNALFNKHPLLDFQELSGQEIEHLGRLGTPIYKAKDSQHYCEVSWQEALDRIAKAMRKTPAQRSFFYSSGRSSNEAGFVLQLLARMYGTNNINNCSYYCHQATGVALTNTIGSGTATVSLEDLNGCDVLFLIGANPASNHPRFIHKLKALRERGGKVIVINPAKEPGLVRFAVPKSAKSLLFGGTEIASLYIQPSIGSDIALFKGIAKAIIEMEAITEDFIHEHTKGYDNFLTNINATEWQEIVECSGISREQIGDIAKIYAESSNTIFAWGMGITHHTHGVENVEYISNLALLRGMVGRPGAGLLPLRGHSNVQGIGTIGVKPVLPQDVFDGIEKNFNITLPSEKGMDTLACLEAAYNNSIDFALLMGGNLYAASPDQQWTKKAMDNINFKVFLTTTLNQGHVNGMDNSEALVLPVTARDEEWQATTQESMFNYVRLSDGGIKRLDHVRPESVILTHIAEQVLPDSQLDFSAFRTHNNIREAIASTIPGMEKLAEIGTSKEEFHISGRLVHDYNFNTQDGQASFITHSILRDEREKPLPYTLTTVRSEGQFNTIVYEQKDSYRDTDDRWSILMNPATIEKLGITENSCINVRSAHGVMNDVKIFPFDLPNSNIMAYFPEANILVGRDHDPRSLTPAFKSVNVDIEVVERQPSLSTS